MTSMTNQSARHGRTLRWAIWGGAATLLLLPLLAMGFTDEVRWTAGDFLAAALLIGGAGLALELAVRSNVDRFYRDGAALGLATGLLLLWSNLAVGYVGAEDNPFNRLFVGVAAVALVGALLARFRAAGMALAMAAAGAAHALVGGTGFTQDPRTGPITLVLVALWLAAAALFRRAARRSA